MHNINGKSSVYGCYFNTIDYSQNRIDFTLTGRDFDVPTRCKQSRQWVSLYTVFIPYNAINMYQINVIGS